jgi:hypothetical protein
MGRKELLTSSSSGGGNRQSALERSHSPPANIRLVWAGTLEPALKVRHSTSPSRINSTSNSWNTLTLVNFPCIALPNQQQPATSMWQGSKISLFVLLFYEGLNYHPDEFSFELLLRSEPLTTRQNKTLEWGC